MIVHKRFYYQGIRKAPYDLVKEFFVALAVVGAVVLVLSLVLSSPDDPPLSLQSISRATPQAYLQTALDSLDGNSPISTYGPPYNNGTGSVQTIGPFSLQTLVGVHIPVNTAQDFVIGPLRSTMAANPTLARALGLFAAASGATQSRWEAAYGKALNKAGPSSASLTAIQCSCGPIATMMTSYLRLGQNGAMDGLLLTTNHFYQTDYTRPLLFMQNNAVQARAQQLNLLGSQWGVMNETGNYPGQAWLWLYTLLYQIPPYTTLWALNVDALAVLTVSLLTMVLLFLPWIPGLNRLPRYLGVYRLIWKDYYREQRAATTDSDAPRRRRSN